MCVEKKDLKPDVDRKELKIYREKTTYLHLNLEMGIYRSLRN